MFSTEDLNVLEKKGGYIAGPKSASALKPPPNSVIAQSPQPKKTR